jgi:hypothetical protein
MVKGWFFFADSITIPIISSANFSASSEGEENILTTFSTYFSLYLQFLTTELHGVNTESDVSSFRRDRSETCLYIPVSTSQSPLLPLSHSSRLSPCAVMPLCRCAPTIHSTIRHPQGSYKDISM